MLAKAKAAPKGARKLKYNIGDIVVAKYQGRDHYTPKGNCVVIDRSMHTYESGWDNSYALYNIAEDDDSAWYDEKTLILIKKRGV